MLVTRAKNYVRTVVIIAVQIQDRCTYLVLSHSVTDSRTFVSCVFLARAGFKLGGEIAMHNSDDPKIKVCPSISSFSRALEIKNYLSAIHTIRRFDVLIGD